MKERNSETEQSLNCINPLGWHVRCHHIVRQPLGEEVGKVEFRVVGGGRNLIVEEGSQEDLDATIAMIGHENEHKKERGLGILLTDQWLPEDIQGHNPKV